MLNYQDERVVGCRISDSWKYRGLKVVILENELIRVSVLADKGADIYEFVYKPSDVDFMWRTPWGVRNPALTIPSTGWGEGIWHDSYIGGWQTIAPTSADQQSYHGADAGFHTEATLMPWDSVITEDTPERVSAKFFVRTIRTPFWIEKKLTLEKNKPVLTINETLKNEAEEDMDYQWGQHVALGEPFLDDKCILDMAPGNFIAPGDRPPNRLKTDQVGKWPFAESPDGSTEDLRTFPAKNSRLQDYMIFKNQKEGWYSVTNPQLKLGFGLSYPINIFRYLWYWQVFGGGYGYPWYGRTYNVGLEPFSSFPAGEPEPGSNKPTSVKIKSGEKVSATIKAVVFPSHKGVKHINQNGEVELK